MQPVLFDTSVYIAALRRTNGAPIILRRLVGAPLWLSSVVLEELYAGAGRRERRVIERLERDFTGAKRILVPNVKDWTQAGQILARLADKYGYEQIGPGRLTNDALIGMSAGRLGIQVLTTNQRDFSRLAELHQFQ